MAKAPTLGTWELELAAQHRAGRSARSHPGGSARPSLDLEDGSVCFGRRCADRELCRRRSQEPAPGPDLGVARGSRCSLSGPAFPASGPRLVGYIEATRLDDAEKNRLCSPSSYGNSLADWARMNARGSRNTAAFSAEPDIKELDRPDRREPGTDPARAPGLGRSGRRYGPAGPLPRAWSSPPGRARWSPGLISAALVSVRPGRTRSRPARRLGRRKMGGDRVANSPPDLLRYRSGADVDRFQRAAARNEVQFGSGYAAGRHGRRG